MSLVESQSLQVVLYEGEGSKPLGAEFCYRTVSALLAEGFAVTRTDEQFAAAPDGRAAFFVLGRFQDGEAPKFASEGAEAAKTSVADINDQAPESVASVVRSKREELGAFPHGAWKPWFPVIDYERCTNCMQCLSFCLFGVYGVDGDNQLQVQNNDNCKTNCPACSRVCPEAAIMFPKYRSGPINGDRVNPADLNREKMKIDISSLLGGDVYQMLRDRSEKAKSRFSKERNPDKALNERKKCLVKLAQTGDVPEEVLMSLPSPEEIQRRAEEASAKAEAARTAANHLPDEKDAV